MSAGGARRSAFDITQIKSWAEDKDPILSINAIQMAMTPTMIIQLLEVLQRPESLPRLPDPPPTDVWLALYREQKRVQKALSAFSTPHMVSDPVDAIILNILVKDAGKSARRTPEQRQAILSEVPKDQYDLVTRQVKQAVEGLVPAFYATLADELIDFASAYLDIPPDFTLEVVEQWQQSKREEFGDRWSEVAIVLDVMQDRFGIYLMDVHPGNITFAATDQ